MNRDYHDSELMTAEQFCEYARQNYVYCEEALMENESQYRSECAMFGDAGPGQALRVMQLQRELKGMEERYFKLTGRRLRGDAYPYEWDFND